MRFALGIPEAVGSNVAYLVCTKEALILKCVHNFAELPRVEGMHSLNLHAQDNHTPVTRTCTPSVS